MNAPESIACHQDLLQHYDWLHSVMAARLNGNRSVADDLLNEMMAEVLGDPAGWKQVDQAGPWLYRVAVRKVANFLRTQKRHRKLNEAMTRDREADAPATGEMLQPLEILIQQEQTQALSRAMESLDGRDREILLLKYSMGWSYGEIETHLGIGFNKIAHRLRRARNRLRSLLNRTDGFGDE